MERDTRPMMGSSSAGKPMHGARLSGTGRFTPFPLKHASSDRVHIDVQAVATARMALRASLTELPIYQLRMEVQSVTPVYLSAFPGSSLRGALVQALLDTHCTNKSAPSCAQCPLVQACPVSTLVAPLRDTAPRGRDVPRPMLLDVPELSATPAMPGSVWSFGLTLFGAVAPLLPYIATARRALESGGIGLRGPYGRRGHIALRRIIQKGPGTHEQQLYADGVIHPLATRSFGVDDLMDRVKALSPETAVLRFLSPTRLVEQQQILTTPTPTTLVHRVLERWEGLRREYSPSGTASPLAPMRGSVPSEAQGDPRAFLAIADAMIVQRDATRWVDLRSYSSRQHRFTPISGFVGDVTLMGDLENLSEVLALGEVIRVGKDVVKGNGHYRILSA